MLLHCIVLLWFGRLLHGTQLQNNKINTDIMNEEKIDRLFAKTEKVLIWVCIGVLISWIILHMAL